MKTGAAADGWAATAASREAPLGSDGYSGGIRSGHDVHTGRDDVLFIRHAGNEQPLGGGPQTELRVLTIPLGPTEMAHQHRATATRKNFFDRRQCHPYSSVIGNVLRSIERHIKINAY